MRISITLFFVLISLTYLASFTLTPVLCSVSRPTIVVDAITAVLPVFLFMLHIRKKVRIRIIDVLLLALATFLTLLAYLPNLGGVSVDRWMSSPSRFYGAPHCSDFHFRLLHVITTLFQIPGCQPGILYYLAWSVLFALFAIFVAYFSLRYFGNSPMESIVVPLSLALSPFVAISVFSGEVSSFALPYIFLAFFGLSVNDVALYTISLAAAALVRPELAVFFVFPLFLWYISGTLRRESHVIINSMLFVYSIVAVFTQLAPTAYWVYSIAVIRENPLVLGSPDIFSAIVSNLGANIPKYFEYATQQWFYFPIFAFLIPVFGVWVFLGIGAVIFYSALHMGGAYLFKYTPIVMAIMYSQIFFLKRRQFLRVFAPLSAGFLVVALFGLLVHNPAFVSSPHSILSLEWRQYTVWHEAYVLARSCIEEHGVRDCYCPGATYCPCAFRFCMHDSNVFGIFCGEQSDIVLASRLSCNAVLRNHPDAICCGDENLSVCFYRV